MTFASKETSRYRGEPVSLYLFTYGAGTSRFAYTDGEQTVTYDDGVTGDVEYVPATITRDNVVASGSLDKSSLSIRMSRDSDIASEFRVYPPTQVMTLVIRQGHLSDADGEFLVVWSGRVLSVGREGEECVITGEPISSSLRRPGLRQHYQIGCPRVLYGTACGASEAAATVSATIASISGLSITLTAGWEGAFAPAKFLEGMVKWANSRGEIETRKILRVTGNVLLLGGYLRDLAATDTVSVVLGCNHQHTAPGLGGDCGDLHNNDQNFGGCKWIPVKNPIGFRNQYY